MKTILITGGSGKVGIQLINHFLKNGFIVITTSRNKDVFLKSEKIKYDNKHAENLKVIEVDFNSPNAINTISSYLKNNNLVPQSIIHNARSLEFLKIENDNSVTTENFMGEFYIDVVFPYSLTVSLNREFHGLENVIFISSIYGIVAPTPALYQDFQKSSPINYGVSKAAQIHLTKELAVRLAPDIRVNCVSFGGIKGRADKSFIERYKSLNPQKKMMEDEDVVGPIEFLISDKSNNMTGQNIIIDGGWTIW
jgi:NAD(P)-dependent dehydrogenase (short-subunit alcohol dehydrogenase family)